MRILLFSFALCFGSFSTAHAGLSLSEQAAQTQRAATPQERQLHKIGCTFKPNGNMGKLRVEGGLSFKQVEIQGFQIMILLQMREQASGGKFAIERFKPLPNGGIAGKDFCEVIDVTTPKSVSGVARLVALRLRSNMDVMKLYPNTAKTAHNRGMLVDIPAGRYIEVKAKGKRRTQWLERQAETWNGRDYSRPGFSLGGTHYIPVLEQR